MYGYIPFFFLKHTRKGKKKKRKKKNSIVVERQPRFKGWAGPTIEMQITLRKQPPAEAQIFTDRVPRSWWGIIERIAQDSQISCRLRYHFLRYNCNVPEETLSQKTVPCASIIFPAAGHRGFFHTQ